MKLSEWMNRIWSYSKQNVLNYFLKTRSAIIHTARTLVIPMGKDMQIPPAKQRVRPLLAREDTQILVLQLIPGWSPSIRNQTLCSSSRMMQSSWYSAWKLSQVTALYVLNRLPISSKIKSLANKSAHLMHPTFLFLCYEVINLDSLKKKATKNVPKHTI